MPNLNLNNAVNSTKNAAVTIPSKTLDSAGASDETEYLNPNAKKYWGIFTSQPDAQTAGLLKSYWVVGGGYTVDDYFKVVVDRIRGWGKDSFMDIVFNMDVMRNVCGDSYAHIIFDGEPSPLNIINIKPLDPTNMKTIVDKQGIIKRYEQIRGDGSIKKFKPEEILHLTCNRLGDQIRGISRFEVLKDTIEAYNEIDLIIRRAANNTAVPLVIWKLKTDDNTLINNFVTRIQNARKLSTGTDVFIPDDENAVRWEIIETSPSQLLMEWKNAKRDDFYRAFQLPQIIPGASGGSSESESKTIYLAHELIVKKEQLALETQIKQQLGIDIKFYPAPSMQPQLQSDTSKDGGLIGSQPSDTQAGVGR